MNPKWFWAICCSVVLSGALYAQSTKLSTGDKQFLKMAAESNMTEAHLGQMAEAQASDDTVKSFGKTVDQDHTHAYAELSKVAEKLSQPIPKGIDIRRDPAIEQLMRMKGNSFDRSFVRDEIRDHQKVLAEFKREAEHGANPDVKAFAQQMIPTIQNHLQKAEDLAKTEKHA
jgi:putative membrane protein